MTVYTENYSTWLPRMNIKQEASVLPDNPGMQPVVAFPLVLVCVPNSWPLSVLIPSSGTISVSFIPSLETWVNCHLLPKLFPDVLNIKYL